MRNSCASANAVLEQVSILLVELCLTNVSGEMLLSWVYLHIFLQSQFFSHRKTLNLSSNAGCYVNWQGEAFCVRGKLLSAIRGARR